MRPFVVGVVAGAAVIGLPAHGETPGATCLGIADAAERLACFDRAIGDAVRGPAAVAAPLPPSELPGPVGAGGTPPGTATSAAKTSLLDSAWGFLPDSNPAYVRLYQPNYLLFARYTSDANIGPYQPLFDEFAAENDFKDVEAKFQLSFKGRLATTDDRRWGLWFAYTQQNQWQVYSEDISRPFRETNYMPELFGSFRPGVEVGGWHWNLLNFGYTHQSNGRADPISRSWDRLFIEAGFERDDFALIARAWTRIEPSNYEDDNPDILDYYGHGEITAFYRRGGNSFTLMARGNLDTGKGAAQFTWATRRLLGPLRGYLQVFTGYGESMIDYDWNQTTIGLGVTLNDKL
ncbi:MAG: phospholipase A [Steroidobacteraceae bacterium]|nr:phospholipase A [Steroidobacteraceae bacterium]